MDAEKMIFELEQEFLRLEKKLQETDKQDEKALGEVIREFAVLQSKIDLAKIEILLEELSKTTEMKEC